PIGRDVDIQHDRLTVPHASQTSLQRRGQLSRVFHLFALQAVSLRNFCEFDVGISEIAVEVLTGLVQRTAIEHVAVATLDVKTVIHNHDEHWRLITGDAPQRLPSAKQESAVTLYGDYLPVRQGNVDAECRGYSPAQCVAFG